MVGVVDEENELIVSSINDSGELQKIEEIKVEFEDRSSESKEDGNELEESKEGIEGGLEVPDTPRNDFGIESAGQEDNPINY